MPQKNSEYIKYIINFKAFIVLREVHFFVTQATQKGTICLHCDIEELLGFTEVPDDLFTLLWQGAYPRIYDDNIPALQWLSDYIATYVQQQ